MKKFLLFALPVFLFLTGTVFMLILPSFFAGRPDLAEQYSRNSFPVLTRLNLYIVSLFPFSVSEMCFFLLVIGIPVFLVFFIIRLCRKPQKARFLRRTALVTSIISFILSFQFCLFMGLNYSRVPLLDSLFPERRERDLDELIEVSMYFAKMTSAARVELNQPGVVMQLQTSDTEALKAGSTAMDAASTDFPVLSGNHVVPKIILASHLLSYTGTTGMYIPFFVEANVNIDIPALDIPHTLCHEIAHARGIAREQDANLAGFLACIYSERIDYQYSGYQFAYRYIISDLYKADKSAYSEVSAMISEDVWNDWANSNEYWKSFEGPVQETAEKMNNTYLKANRQKEGVLSYNLVTEMIIEYYFSYIKPSR